MRIIISFAALFLSVIFLQLSSGGVAPLDALSGIALGFSAVEIGLLGSAHFAGFFLGCWWAPRLLGSIGHSRTFGAFAALGTIAIAAHMMVVDPLAWTVMRAMTGLCVAGCYTVIEAWLQAKVTNETRARSLGIYRMVDLAASMAAQLLIGVLEPAAYLSYNLLAILCCASILPLILTRIEPPQVAEAPRLRPLMVFGLSPLGAAAVLVAGISSASFRMVGPIYGAEVGLAAEQIGLFLAAFVAGGAVSLVPVGWLADKLDRRRVLVWLSLASVVSCGLTVALVDAGTGAVFAAAILFGMTTVPVYSVAAAHANDFARPEDAVELNAAILFVWAMGAIASPLVAAALIGIAGPSALFMFIAAAHAALLLFGLARMRVRPSPGQRTPFAYLPRTSALVGRLLRRRR